MAQPLDPGIVQDDGGAMSVPDLDSGAGAASDTSADTGAANIDPGITDGGGDLGAADNNGLDAGAATVVTPGPGGGPVQGVPGDTGFDPEQSGAEGAQAGGANVQFQGADLNPHTGVPGDTGIDLGDSGVAGGQAGKADIGQTDDHGNTNFPGDTGIDEDVMDQSGGAGAATVVTPGPGGGPVQGVPGDTGFDPEQSGAEGAQAGGANVQFQGADLNPHTGVPGDTGIDLGDSGVAGGQAGKADIGQTDDHGNTNFPGDTGIDEDVMDQSGGAGAATVVTPGPGGGPVQGVPGDTGGDADPATAPGAGDLGGVDDAGNAGPNAPGATPASAVLSDFSAGGQPGDTGAGDAGAAADTAGLPGGTDLGQVDDSGDAFHGVPGETGEPDMGAAAGTAGLPGGTDLGQVDDAGNAVHGVPGDTGVAADNPAGNPFLNDVSAGTTGDGSHDIPDVDPNSPEGEALGGLFGGAGDAANSAELAHNLPEEGQAGDVDPGQPDGSHDIPDVDPNSAEGGGFLGGLFGGAGDAANSAELAHNLPEEGQAGDVDPGQSGDHGGFPLLNDLAAGLTGHTDPAAAGEPGAHPASGVAGLVSSFDHMLNPDAGSVADNFGQPGHGVIDPGAVGGLDHPAAAASAAGGTGQTFNPEAGHVADFPGGGGVINDPASNVHDVSTPHQTIVDPGASGDVRETATSHSPVPHEMPAPGAEIGTTGHYGGENPQAYLSGEHGAAAPTESEAQPAHEGGEDNSHVLYLHPEQEPTHSAESYEHHGT